MKFYNLSNLFITVIYVSFLIASPIYSAQSTFGQDTLPLISVMSPNGGETWHDGKQPKIVWNSRYIDSVNIFYSIDNGSNWSLIRAGINANLKYIRWTVAPTYSNRCLIKVVNAASSNVFDVSDSLFRIKPDDGKLIKFVILGSSTAYGTGPANPDSAWVRRYADYLYQTNTSIYVINLAYGGYTTYHVMPDGFIPPAGRPYPASGHNITTALQYSPDIILVNLPSNDAAALFTIHEQLMNYDTIAAYAFRSNIPIWVATPQPRNLNQSGRDNLLAMLDSINTKFGNRAIDFWTEIAYSDGSINPAYNSGDGIHLNNAGHRILFNRVLAKRILEYLYTVLPVKESPNSIPKFSIQQNYPNPVYKNGLSPSKTTIRFNLAETSAVQLSVYDILGNEVANLYRGNLNRGSYDYDFDTRNLATGIYLYSLTVNGKVYSKKMMILK